MTQDEWAALVRRLEPEARREPRSYARKVAALGGLGYAFIGVSLLVLLVLALLVVALALSGPGVLLKLLLPIGALGWLILRSLSVRIDSPGGVPVMRKDAPELWRMIDEVNETVQGPKVHKVLVDAEPNAAIVQIPRRGALFGSRNYLVLGLPYFQALSPDEFRAVVAHELGHLSRSHGRFGAWIYRIRTTWWQLLSALEEKRHWTTGLFRRFFEWYVPRFDAYSFPLRRAHEFEADEAAAAAAGPQAAMTALLSGTIGGRYVYEEYWPKVFARVNDESEPPRSAFAPMRDALVAARSGEDVRSLLEAELTREPDVADTHPSLLERIEHLGLDPRELVASVAATPLYRTAAEAYLGEAEFALADILDESWRESVATEWGELHQEQREARSELEALERRADANADLDLDDLRRLADLTEEFRSEDEALERQRAVLARDENDAGANFAVGRHLLARGEDSGLAHLERAMEYSHEAVLPGCELASEYLEQRGRHEEARRYRERGKRQLDVYEAAAAEREELDVEDELLPAELDAGLIEQLKTVLARHDEVGRAYVVRKGVRHLADEEPLYLLAVIPKHQWRQLWRDVDADDDPEKTSLPDRIGAELEVPVNMLVFVPGPRSRIKERLDQVEGARIV